MARIFKEMVKKSDLMYVLVFFVWGIVRILRIKYIFSNLGPAVGRSDKKVLIFGVRTLATTNLVYFDAFFGQAFKKLGCKVKMLYCDGLMDSCDADTMLRSQKPACTICRTLGPSLKQALNLDCLSLKKFITKEEIDAINEKVNEMTSGQMAEANSLGVEVGAHAVSSAVRYFLAGRIDLQDPEHEKKLREKLKAAMIMTKIAAAIYDQEKPDIIFMLHGIYSTWGPFFDYFRLKKVDVIAYGNAAYRFGSFVFLRNGREYEFVYEKMWNKYRNEPFPVEEKKQITDYLAERFKGLVGDHLMYRENFEDKKKQCEFDRLNQKKYENKYVLYPNLAWDACVEGRSSGIFKSLFDWIDNTIEFFMARPEYQLIIKPHPAELIWEKGTESISKYINRKFPQLPENIVLLKADTPLNAYEVIQPDGICLTFNGTIGLEFATQGMPVIVAGNSHYKDAGIVYKIESLEDYRSLLEQPYRLLEFSNIHKELAIKYAYFYFFKLMIRIPFYRGDVWSEIDWRYVANTGKLFNENNNLMKICNYIVTGREIIEPL